MQRMKTKLGVLRVAAVVLLALVAGGCDTDSPTAPQTPATPPPPAPGPSAVWNITVTANPSTVEIPDAATAVSIVISVVVRRADNNQPPPDGATAIVETTFASGVVVLNGGTGSAVLTLSSPSAGSLIVRARFESSVGQTVIDLVAAPTFRVDRISPDQGPAEGGTRVRVEGAGFAEPVRVLFDNLTAFVESVSDSAIVVETPRFDGLAAGESRRVAVSVTINLNESNQQTDTLADAFTYLAAGADPLFIERIVPDEGPPSGGTRVSIRGSGFQEPARVTFGGLTAVVDSVTGNEIVVETPRFDGLAAGEARRVDVTVTVDVNGEEENADTLVNGFTYISEFFVDRLVPSEGSPTGGERVRILGNGFEEPVRVLFGNDRADVVSVDPTVIVVETPTINLAVGETLSVPVTVVINVNQADELSETVDNAFLYTRGGGGGGALVPRIISITPTSGPNEGGTEVTIRGEGFADEVQLFFGTATLIEAEVTDVAPERILAITPPATGFNSVNRDSIVDVLVRNVASGFEDTLLGGFQYGSVDAPPIFISAVGPTEGLYTGGDIVTLFGSGFEGPATVAFAGIAQDVLSVTGTEIVVRSVRADIEGCAEIRGPVAVTNIETGQGAQGPEWIYRVFDPGISSIVPSSVATDAFGVPVGDTLMTITGSGFDPPVSVEFGQVLAFGAAVTDSSTLTLTIPSFTGDFETESCDDNGDGTEGERQVPARVDLTITNQPSDCFLTLTEAFTYVPPSDCVGDESTTPTIFDIAPRTSDEDGVPVTITGANFREPVRVLFGDVAASGTVVVNEGRIDTNAPPFNAFEVESCDDNGDGTSGERFIPTTVDVTVINVVSGEEDSFPNSFTYDPSASLSVCRNDVGPPPPPPPLPLPTASFTFDATSGNAVGAGGTVFFTDTSSGADSVTYDFGDGSATATVSPGTAGLPHVYTTDGPHTVTLTATNASGSDLDTQIVTIPAN